MNDKQAHHHDEHCGHEHGHDDHEPHEHGLVDVTIQLEDEHIPALDEVAAELTRDLRQPWDPGPIAGQSVPKTPEKASDGRLFPPLPR